MSNSTDSSIKVLENRLRRVAERRGLRLVKSRRRDPQAYDYGTYALIDVRSNALVAGDELTGYGLTLEDVEATLNAKEWKGRAPAGQG